MADGGLLVWLVVGGVLLVLLVGVAVEVVPEHQRLVVTRLGRIDRVAGPGVTFRLPGLEDVTVVSLRPSERHIGVSTTTRDGVAVRFVVRVVCRVADPSRSLLAPGDAYAATLSALESRLQHEIAQRDASSVLVLRADLESHLPAAANEVTAAWGVEVLEVTLLDVEARLRGELLRGLRRHDEPR